MEFGLCTFDFFFDFGHLPDTQGSLGILSTPCTPTQTTQGWWDGGEWLANKILQTDQSPIPLSHFGFDTLGFGARTLDFGLGLGFVPVISLPPLVMINQNSPPNSLINVIQKIYNSFNGVISNIICVKGLSY